jgi:hypothetical protein
MLPRPPGSSIPRPSPENAICHGLVSAGGFGAGCTELENLFRTGVGPLALSWGFSGAGQQISIVSGLVSDDVVRIEVFQGDGRRWRAPLRDNATAFRVQRAKFPIRVVGSDAEDRAIAVRTIRGG